MTYTFEVHYDEFENKDSFLTLFRPVPASEMLPDWFKKLDNPSITMRTAKSCRGVYDMMTAGYMILWNVDVVIFKDENGKFGIRKVRSGGDEDFHPHPHWQLEGYPDGMLPFQRRGVEKLVPPYRMHTPPGTSVLMIQPAYRPDLKTEVMPGIIDTDKFYSQMNVLFTIKDLNTSREIKINAGTPLAQVIPFVRSEWEIKFDRIDHERANTMQHNLDNLDHYYQKFLWAKKIFKRKVK